MGDQNQIEDQFSFHLMVSVTLKCGRIVGYQYKAPDAYDTILGGSSSYNNINSYYVDGVSITHGTPHQYVWTAVHLCV